MRMRNFQSKDYLCHFLARKGITQSCCHLLCKNLEGSELFVVHVKYIIYLSPWYYESMSLCHGIYIKEGIEPVILGTFITWYLPCGYFAEYIHDISH